MDPGSEVSLVSAALVRRFGIPRRKSLVQLSGDGDSTCGSTSGSAQLTIRSAYSSFQIVVTAHIFDRLMAALPSFSAEEHHWPHLATLQLADPGFRTPAPVDVLIGADAFGEVLLPEVIQAGPSLPVAQRTHLGWLVFGPTGCSPAVDALALHVRVSDDQLRSVLSRFWVQEEVPSSPDVLLSSAELACEEHFKKTHRRDSFGRYIVRLPFLSSPTALGDSHRTAISCFARLRARLQRDPHLRQLYLDFMTEYESLGHMTRVAPQSSRTCRVPGMTLAHGDLSPGGSRVPGAWQQGGSCGTSHSYFLPHHGVLKESSATTKLRVVFNGSAPTSSGASINDLLHTGAKLQADLSDVLLWVRRHRFVFMADITKMFRQIRVHEEDWPYQQIVWSDHDHCPITYQLTTVTYGMRPAPFLAGRKLLQLVEDEGPRFPLAVAPMLHGRYVDDICGGSDTVDQLIGVGQQVRGLCAAGGFPLSKWQTNDRLLTESLGLSPSSECARAIDVAGAKILGLLWTPEADSFSFALQSTFLAPITKRVILSELAQLYDPLGFLSPVVIRGKALLQDLWLDKLGWDDEVSPTVSHRWAQFRSDLRSLDSITIPRWLGLMVTSTVEIHGFADASQTAMAAVVYLKITNPDSRPIISFVCSKTRVAPLKRVTIPRLELSAAVLLVRLVQYVQRQFHLSAAPTVLWTDSAVTLAWVNSSPSRWKEYVRNRVHLIQELPATWRHVPGQENPADCASRGVTVDQLARHPLWWSGPAWLRLDPEDWPITESLPAPSARLEEKPGSVLSIRAHQPVEWDLIHRFSSLARLMRVTATCQRAVARFRRTQGSSLAAAISVSDLAIAQRFWVQATQAAHFPTELELVARGESVRVGHPLARLTPFLDHQGILRVGGRLSRAPISFEQKHPIILPRTSAFTQLVIRDAHFRTLHGGNQITLARLRQEYWVLGGRAPVRSFILRCVTCSRQRAARAQQLMGQLPIARLTPSRPFLHTGVDYAGPVSLRSWKGRGHRSVKGWLSIFVCMVTSAIHLEVVSDYTADGFLGAYRRFVSRRGLCLHLYSDCGTTFQGADRLLRTLFSSASAESQELARVLLNDGGKWEAAVRSVKHHLVRTIGDDLLTFEELSTLLTQIEAVLNCRPLEPLTDDPDDLGVLTPGHFLVGAPLIAIPKPSLEHVSISRAARWQLLQQKLQAFWKRWSTSYLQQLQAVAKWQRPSHEVRIGSVVLLGDERTSPTRWPLARVIALHPGRDGLARVATIKTATTTLTRPIVKLIPLPVDPARDDAFSTDQRGAHVSHSD